MAESPVHPGMTVYEVVARWPATRFIFERYGIPTEVIPVPAWETVEQAAAASGHWAADQLLSELNQVAGDDANIQANTPLSHVVATYPATQASFERYGIPCHVDCTTRWETIEQAAAAHGHWADSSLLDELNAPNILKISH